ncbi:hypothetical protein DFJ67_5226 [Asanoa ferruginea]|uniref:Uncharacterized protein n=1 Tax=Asanoa ferruginea TaxID=53367 RepID=A0A3D9ZQP4_9ACTN|nr:hypothetical protein [Asanoa ferruginea]REF99199.1 hypothetical protein DFJ67_5226 [Asanoa ferruginea]GIF45791.1 hypothetical protein Afe04nite_03300 [Asanoa ferruginea]
MKQEALIDAGDLDGAMEREFDEMRRVAAKFGEPGLYDAAIDEFKSRFGKGSCP